MEALLHVNIEMSIKQLYEGVVLSFLYNESQETL